MVETVEILRLIDDGYEQVDIRILSMTSESENAELSVASCERRVYANELWFAKGSFSDIKPFLPLVQVRVSGGICRVQ